MRFAEVTTLEAAIATKEPTLTGVSRMEGWDRTKVTAMVKAHIIALNAFLNQRNPMTPEAIDLTADEIVRTYGYGLSFADIHVIFRKAKLGEYGNLYGSLTCADIMGWVRQYFSDRAEAYAERNRREDERRYGSHEVRTRRAGTLAIGEFIQK